MILAGMGTRATIKFSEGEDVYYVYRGHDGFPDNIQRDFKDVLKQIKGRWSEPDLGLLVTSFLAFTFDPQIRLPHYELTPSFHGDESYKYEVTWNPIEKSWRFDVLN